MKRHIFALLALARWGPLGFGVTAWSVEDAIQLIKAHGFDIPESLDLLQVQENVTIADLDQNHVVPNMGPNSTVPA